MEDLSTATLIRRLCSNIARDAVLDPGQAAALAARLFDSAFVVLIGLEDPGTPYVPPDARTAATQAALDKASGQLAACSYPELAASLTSLASTLHRVDAVSVLGTKLGQLTGAPAVVPLSEQDALLSFLLALQGTRLSVRRRQVTMQTAHEAPVGAVTAPLSSAVFDEPPDPNALTDISTTVALLPSECGYPTDPFAGAGDVQDLSAYMSGRPAWNPTATAYAPKPASAAWLPVPSPLVEMQADPRRGARPPPLGVPWSLLSMGEAPGANTVFQDLGAHMFGAESNGPLASPAAAGPAPAAGSAAPPAPGATPAAPALEGGGAVVQNPGGGGDLWTLEEADLARDALLALQGVHSALMRLQGALDVPHALPRRSVAGVLSKVAAAAELRQRLQAFVAAHLDTVGTDPAPGAAMAAAAGVEEGAAQADGEAEEGGGDAQSGTNALAARTPLAQAAAAAAERRRAGGGGRADPVLRAFAAAVGEVLRQQAAALQALERSESTTWVRCVEVAGKPGRQLHRRGLTLLQVALHTGRLQTQLRSLAGLCWCLPGQGAAGAEDEAELQPGASEGAAAQQWAAFPRGSALLTYLHQSLVEADDAELPTRRFLFGQALAPYLSHLHSWGFSAAPLHPAFATRAEEAVAPCLEFLPPPQPPVTAAGPGGGAGSAASWAGVAAAPCDPPSFLRPLHAAFLRAGAQLRLLASLPQHGKDLAAQLASIAEQEAPRLLLLPPSPGAARAAGAGAGVGACLPPLALPGGQHSTLATQLSLGVLGGSSSTAGEERDEEGSWLGAGGAAAAGLQPGAGLLLTSTQLQQAAVDLEQADAARQEAVEGWLRGLALRRHQAEQAAAAEALGRTATVRERHMRAAAREAERLAQQRASKAQLLRQQSDELAAQRARAAAQRTQQLAEEQGLLVQAALKEHSDAVAELAAALEASSLGAGGSLPAAPAPVAAPAASSEGGRAMGGAIAAAAAAAEGQPPQQQPQRSAAAAGRRLELSQELADATSSSATQPPSSLPQLAELGPPAAAACPAALEPLELPAGPAAPTGAGVAAVPRQQRGRWQHIEAALGAKLPSVLPALGAFQSLEGGAGALPSVSNAQQQLQGSKEQGAQRERPAPLSAVLELCVAQSVASQYRAVSRACVRLFLDELHLLAHLEALRRLFFMGAGDWAEALVAALGAQADSLEPLTQHGLERMLAESARGTSLEQDPYAARLRVRLLPGLSTISAQVQAVSLPTPQRRGSTRPRAPAGAVVVPPSALDGLDCVALDYDMGWPLAAVITEDIMQGYAAVFSQLVRLKRVEQLLRALHAPLMQQPQSTADMLLGEEEAGRAYRQLQRLRAFRNGAAQLVAAVQAFLHSRIAGEGWVQLLAKLMVSSEQVAATVLGRGPSAALTGVLSRMSSVAGSGSAAHRLVRLAKSLSRQASLASASSRSQPGTPSSATAAAAAAEAAALLGSAASGGAGGDAPKPLRTSRPLGPSRLSSVAVAGALSAGACAAAPPMQQQQAQQQQEQEQGQQAGGPGAPGPWQGQQREGEDGIADLQELLDLHRAYIRGASADCLTFGGRPDVRAAVDAALQGALDFALRLQAAVRLGSAGRTERSWVQVLRRDATWAPLAQSMAAFDGRVAALHMLLAEGGGRGVLAELALQLDFNGFYSSQQQQSGPRRR